VRTTLITPLMLALALAPVTACAPASAAESGQRVCLNAVGARLVDTLNSAIAKPGESFRFRTTELAVINADTVPLGTLGYGVVRSVNPAARGNKYGSLALEPRYLLLRDRQIAVSMNPTFPVELASNTPLVEKAASHVPLPIPGMAMTAINEFRRGKDVTLGPTFTFSIVPINDLARGPDC
jgi:hypothetical protein